MRFAVRLVIAIWLSALAVIGGSAYMEIGNERGRLRQDLESRAALLGDGVTEAIQPALNRGPRPALQRLLKKFGRRGQEIAVYGKRGELISATPDIEPLLPRTMSQLTATLAMGEVPRGFTTFGEMPVYLYVSPLSLGSHRQEAAVAIFLDASSVAKVEWERWRDAAVRFLALAILLGLIAWAFIALSITRPMNKMARWAKGLQRGGSVTCLRLADDALFGPMAREVTVLAKSLHRAQAAAEEEAALRLTGDTLWTEERLKQFVKLRLQDHYSLSCPTGSRSGMSEGRVGSTPRCPPAGS